MTMPITPTMPFHCRDCRKFFSAKTGTVMHSSKIGYRKWALAIYIFTTGLKGTSSMKLHRDLGVSQKTAWHMAHRIRKSFGTSENPFAGPVEVDETWVGGKEKNMHESHKLNAGRGAGWQDSGYRSEGPSNWQSRGTAHRAHGQAYAPSLRRDQH